LQTHTLPHEDDGVQLILSTFIPDSIENTLLQKILITLWHIWKARNDKRFARKNWTIWQVHHAVAAHITTATSEAHISDEQEHQGNSLTQGQHAVAVTHGTMINSSQGMDVCTTMPSQQVLHTIIRPL